MLSKGLVMADPVPAAALRLAQIRERLEKISGPWRSMRDGNQYIKTRYLPTAKVVAASRIDGLVRPWNPHAYVAFGFKPEEFETSRFLNADADFIAEAPADVTYLLAALARAEQTIREQHDALKAAAGWYGLDGDGISDPVRAQVLAAIAELQRSRPATGAPETESETK